VTVTPSLELRVSRRIREEFENGRDYYALQGSSVRLPLPPPPPPSASPRRSPPRLLRPVVVSIVDWVAPIGVIDSRTFVEGDRQMDHRTVRGSPMPVLLLRFCQHNVA